MLFFTLCHINQLPEAQVLGDSIKLYHPDAEFYIGLVDKKDRIPGNFEVKYSVIDLSEIKIDYLQEMAGQYTQDELLANAKPFFAKHFLQLSPKLVYFDSSTLVYSSLEFIEKNLDTYDIIIVPQLLHAGVHPDEKQTLNTGIFHSGCLALKQSDEARRFLDWWGNNTAKKGYIDLCKGLNADQLWLEHVPNLYNNVLIEKHKGLNIGVWNLPERKIDSANNTANGKALVSVNFKGMKHWPDYKKALQQYSIVQTTPFYGLQNPENKKFGKKFARNIRKINSFIDKLVDLI